MYSKETMVFVSGGRSNYRIPSMVATKDGTVLAFCNDRKDSLDDHAEEVALVCARKKPGAEWEPVRTLTGFPGWSCGIGSAVYDADTDTVFLSGGRAPVAKQEFGEYTQEELDAIERETQRRERELGIRRGGFLLSSKDGGETWVERDFVVNERTMKMEDGTEQKLDNSGHGNASGCHGCAHGIQLRYGEHKGRLLCPSRTFTGEYNTWDGLRAHGHNNAIYSDDHGETWTASDLVQAGTGEGALIERGDGSILYNSRAYFWDSKRYLAVSRDGGETYSEFSTDDFLLEVEFSGCNASFLRVAREDFKDVSLLPEGADSVTVFVNPRCKDARANLTACISFDEGKTWSKTKTIWNKMAAYSSLEYSVAEQKFYLLYEKGEQNPYEFGLDVLEFDLEWLLNEE